MGKKNKDIAIDKSFRYKAKYNEYTLKLRRRNYWWLLLLLPLLLFIKCHKDITVTCVDAEEGVPIDGMTVTMNYQAHFLADLWCLLPTDDITRSEVTDSTGTVVFRDVPCSVFSYIFYCMSDATFSAGSECYDTKSEKHNFHFTKKVELRLRPHLEDLHIKLLDLETDDLLPDGRIVYRYVKQGKELTDSASADPAGVVTIPGMRYCGVMSLLTGRCYGYADTARADAPCQMLLLPDDSTALRLRPLKDRFTFFVKDLYSKQPIPGAECFVTLNYNGRTIGPNKVTTSTDGKGIAVYENAFVLATISIKAQKPPHYNDSILNGGPWVVEDFIKQDEDTRTIWLRPLPFMKEFVNIDSITGKPIPGVKNTIRITDADRTTRTVTEISNDNGIFPVSATEDATIEIVSEKSPEYKVKNTKIPRFADADKEIPMSPVMETLTFRTLVAKKGTLLPDCELTVTGTVSGKLPYTNSGKGEFQVTFRRGELLSITASKTGYQTNSSTVKNKTWDYLHVSQDRRDIPLDLEQLRYSNADHPKYGKKCYPFYKTNRKFTIVWDLCSVCTMITVTDSNGNVIDRYGIDSPAGDGRGTRYTPNTGSATLTCPTETVCVIIQSVNQDRANFYITTID